MKEKTKQRVCHFLSLALFLALLMQLIPLPTQALEGNIPSAAPQYDDSEEVSETGRLRLTDAEPNLYTRVYQNEDGTQTMKLYGQPVKFINSDGVVQDISLSLTPQTEAGGYISAQHAISTHFSRRLTDASHWRTEIQALHCCRCCPHKPLLPSHKLLFPKIQKRSVTHLTQKRGICIS